MSRAVRLYARLLRLYPRRFREEFADEMQAVFAEAAAKAKGAERLELIVREVRDWPGAVILAHWQERKTEADMETLIKASNGRERISWIETLVGLWPFLLFGPVSVLLAYPYPMPDWRYVLSRRILIACVSLFPLGLGIGWFKRWPRWSYTYLGLALLVLSGFVVNAIFRIVFEVGPEWPFWPQAMIAIGVFALTMGVLLLAARAWRPLLSLYLGVRRDWTQLSFGLFLGAGILFGLIDHEEDPVLTVFVFLPSLIVLLGAFAYLRSATKAQRILAMLTSLALAIGVRAAGGKFFYGGYGAVLGVIIFIPALLELLPPADPSRAKPPVSITS